MDEYAGLIRGVIFGSGFAGHQTSVLYTPPTPPGGADVLTVGIYREEPVTEAAGDSFIQTTVPVVAVRRDAIVGGPLAGAQVTVRGELFEVWTVHGPDETDICRLQLKRL